MRSRSGFRLRARFIPFYGQGFTLTLLYGLVLRSRFLAGGTLRGTEVRRLEGMPVKDEVFRFQGFPCYSSGILRVR
jgi:hypothetical protein